MELECNRKKKPLPKQLKPLADRDLIKAAMMNFYTFDANSIAKVSIYNYFAKELLSNQERLVVT
jgi:hypothetical protein